MPGRHLVANGEPCLRTRLQRAQLPPESGTPVATGFSTVQSGTPNSATSAIRLTRVSGQVTKWTISGRSAAHHLADVGVGVQAVFRGQRVAPRRRRRDAGHNLRARNVLIRLDVRGRSVPAHMEAYQHVRARRLWPAAPLPLRGASRWRRNTGCAPTRIPGEMIRAEHPDIVHLVTWPDTRVELMTLVSELGVPLCTTEKPLATAVKDWRKLVDLERTSATKFGVCHQLRWQTHLVKCQEALNSGRLGRVLFLDISAGMNIAGQGTHTLNYGMSLMGDVPVARSLR